MIRPVWRRRFLLQMLAAVLAVVVGAGAADASVDSRAASLKISAPASMARGSVLTVKATGYSGPYNTVSWSSVHGASSPCQPPNADTITMHGVASRHTFNVRLTNIFGAPGTMTVCVYLFTSGPRANYTKGHYIVRSARVRVS